MSKKILNEPGFSEQVLKDIEISPEHLDDNFIKHGALLAFYIEQSRNASKRADNLKLQVDVVYGRMDRGIRTEAAMTGSKLTEKMVENIIIANDKYIDAVNTYNDAKATAQMLRDTLDAFKQRKDMLVQIGLNRRDEIKSASFHLNNASENELRARRNGVLSPV